MLVAVEGPSAVGKTTLLRQVLAERVVGEEWEALGIPRGSGSAEPQGVDAQQFWVDLNSRRWQLLVDIEARHGEGYADSDPLKLYYNFALTSIGKAPHEVFEEGWRWTRRAMEERRLGFVDRVVYLQASPGKLAQRKAADASCSRRGFDLHVRLGHAMEAYYAAVERLRPGAVRWLDAEGEAPADAICALEEPEAHRRHRYDVTVLDRLKGDLDDLLTKGS